MTSRNDIDDLVKRLEKLTKRKGEQYRFGTPIAAARMDEFEGAHGISVPDEYRAFLLAVGEGASGPDYGLVSLAKAVKERGDTIYTLADPFPVPESTADLLDFGVGGILPVCYGGCSYFTGIVTTGSSRGEMWFSVEDRPGWVPCWHGAIRGEDGEPFIPSEGDPYRATYDAVLSAHNVGLRIGFAAWYSSWLDGEERRQGIGRLS